MKNQRLKQRRKELKLTQQDVADIVAVSKTSVSQWESGETSPRGENMHNLCKVLKRRPEWVLYGTGDPELIEQDYDETRPPAHIIKVVNDKGATIPVADEFFKLKKMRPSDCVAFKAPDNAMATLDGGTIPKDSVAIINTSDVELRSDEVYLIDFPNGPRLRQCLSQLGTQWKVQTVNPNVRDEQIVDADDIKIIGATTFIYLP